MRSGIKLIAGVISALLGGAGIILGQILGFSELPRPWSFILGFIFGVLGGAGAVLSLSSLRVIRRG